MLTAQGFYEFPDDGGRLEAGGLLEVPSVLNQRGSLGFRRQKENQTGCHHDSAENGHGEARAVAPAPEIDDEGSDDCAQLGHAVQQIEGKVPDVRREDVVGVRVQHVKGAVGEPLADQEDGQLGGRVVDGNEVKDKGEGTGREVAGGDAGQSVEPPEDRDGGQDDGDDDDFLEGRRGEEVEGDELDAEVNAVRHHAHGHPSQAHGRQSPRQGFGGVLDFLNEGLSFLGVVFPLLKSPHFLEMHVESGTLHVEVDVGHFVGLGHLDQDALGLGDLPVLKQPPRRLRNKETRDQKADGEASKGHLELAPGRDQNGRQRHDQRPDVPAEVEDAAGGRSHVFRHRFDGQNKDGRPGRVSRASDEKPDPDEHLIRVGRRRQEGEDGVDQGADQDGFPAPQPPVRKNAGQAVEDDDAGHVTAGDGGQQRVPLADQVPVRHDRRPKNGLVVRKGLARLRATVQGEGALVIVRRDVQGCQAVVRAPKGGRIGGVDRREVVASGHDGSQQRDDPHSDLKPSKSSHVVNQDVEQRVDVIRLFLVFLL